MKKDHLKNTSFYKPLQRILMRFIAVLRYGKISHNQMFYKAFYHERQQ